MYELLLLVSTSSRCKDGEQIYLGLIDEHINKGMDIGNSFNNTLLNIYLAWIGDKLDANLVH